MAPTPSGARRTPTGRRRGRPPGSTNAARAARIAALATAPASEPPPKRRRYIPGGPGGGGRFIDPDSLETVDSVRAVTVARPRAIRSSLSTADSPSLAPRRARSSRIQGTGGDDLEEMRWGSAAAVAASVKQAEDYKPREERNWEEFHPNLDIDAEFMIFPAQEVDAPPSKLPPHSNPVVQSPVTPAARAATPTRDTPDASATGTPNATTLTDEKRVDVAAIETPSRRSRRSATGQALYLNSRSATDLAATPKTPKILPIQNQTAKEKLDLKLPSFRRTNRVELLETETFGQARYVDKSMSNVGYQESDNFVRPEKTLIKAVDPGIEDEADALGIARPDEGQGHHSSRIGRVEYDMDEQDDMWLEQYNSIRKQNDLEAITREMFEIILTKIEKEWHALEKRIPKPNPKPPQTHRPRSSSAAAVNGETQAADEPDSKCVVCDDGDCENTNAIVFCDGCNLAVHQECYGVPFIPEGQWLCRKCQLCGRGVPTCIFCPNTDGAFKQTNSSKWAHLLCAMWIPEVSLGNHTFMEPVMEVEKVPKSRWKLSCYICNQKMGACIQCGNKNCYQAFHVTCARRAHLYLKMKTPHGALAVLEGSMILKAFCDKHCPPDYTEEHGVAAATRLAKKFYKRNMHGRIWAENHAVANAIAAQQRDDADEDGADQSMLAGGKTASAGAGVDKKKNQPAKNVWRLPSGAPVLPQAVFETVELSIQRFTFRKRKEFLREACRYWTLKREARRGAALLKRLQLQMDSFTSMELTRRDFAAMGPGGREKLARRIEFAQGLLNDLEQLKALSAEVVHREEDKLAAVELERDFVDEVYFPVTESLLAAAEKAIALDKDLFGKNLRTLRERVEQRLLVNGLSFARELGYVVATGIINKPVQSYAGDTGSSSLEHTFTDVRERRKLGRRILKAVQPYLETAFRVESVINHKSCESLMKELERINEASLEVEPPPSPPPPGTMEENTEPDTLMADMQDTSEITVKHGSEEAVDETVQADVMVSTENADAGGDESMDTSEAPAVTNDNTDEGLKGTIKDVEEKQQVEKPQADHADASDTPPGSNGYMTIPQVNVPPNPPTPPQSNGSFGKEAAAADVLSEGGIVWYLREFEPQGTTVIDPSWPAEHDASRQQSEDLTDLDDDELRGLRANVEDAVMSLDSDVDTPATPTEAASVVPSNSSRNTRAAKRLSAATAASPVKRRVSSRRR